MAPDFRTVVPSGFDDGSPSKAGDGIRLGGAARAAFRLGSSVGSSGNFVATFAATSEAIFGNGLESRRRGASHGAASADAPRAAAGSRARPIAASRIERLLSICTLAGRVGSRAADRAAAAGSRVDAPSRPAYPPRPRNSDSGVPSRTTSMDEGSSFGTDAR
jgi:hypothetical protein